MILTANSGAGSHYEKKSRSRAESHIFLSENEPIPCFNGPILTIAQMMKYVLSSAAEVEMSSLFLTAKEMVPVRHTLTEMVWHQTPSPIKCDDSTAVIMTNYTLVPRKSKSWHLRLHWLQCR